MNGEYEMSESHKYPCVEKLLKEREYQEKLFYKCFLILLVIGVFLLWFNTRRQEPQAIKELAHAIEKNAKTVTRLQETKENSNKIEQKKHTAKIPNTSNNPVEYTLMNETKASSTEDVPKFYTIRREDFENSLKAVALTSRQEAAEDYHKSFSILVAMLALFGIGFPVIVAFIQHSFNQKELEKIKDVTIQAEDAVIQAESATIKANDAIYKADNTTIKTDNAINQIKNLGYDFYDQMIGATNGLETIYASIKNDYSIIMYYYYHGLGILFSIRRYLLKPNLEECKKIPEALIDLLDTYHNDNIKQKIIDKNCNEVDICNLNEMRNNVLKALNDVIEYLNTNDKQQDKENEKMIETLDEYRKKIENEIPLFEPPKTK